MIALIIIMILTNIGTGAICWELGFGRGWEAFIKENHERQKGVRE